MHRKEERVARDLRTFLQSGYEYTLEIVFSGQLPSNGHYTQPLLALGNDFLCALATDAR